MSHRLSWNVDNFFHNSSILNNNFNTNNISKSFVTTTTATRKHHHHLTTTRRMVHLGLGLYSRLVLGISLFFWTWALKNSIGMDAPNFDYGLISFGTTALTSTYLLGRDVSMATRTTPTLHLSNLTICFVVSSQLLVSLNYILGILVGIYVLHRIGFAIYCGIFSILWMSSAWYGLTLMRQGTRSITVATTTNHETSSLV